MKNSKAFSLLALASLLPLTVLAATPYYWVDSNGEAVRDGANNCIGALYHGADIPACRGEIKKEIDSDGDGISDANDQCPATPAGTHVDATGCAMVMDADRDGVADAADRCPNTPANAKVDAAGCPLDSDRDGVADYLDQCANTASGSTVDEKGCAQKVVVRDLNFATNSAELSAEAKAILDKVAAGVSGDRAIRQVMVTGYSDDRGDAGYNKALSERRARSVADYLSSKGLSGLQITSQGMGEANPIADNATAAGRAENRRVEIDLK
ncbi:MAG: OmpA family protein [Gammaproteobacteria bacterium]|nr:OmpA family protein [Gammaproteobacteria bacterium]